jgi:hypothetical protein
LAASAFTDSISSSIRCSCVACAKRVRQRNARAADACMQQPGAANSATRLLLLDTTPCVVILRTAGRVPDSGQPQPRAPDTSSGHSSAPRARQPTRGCAAPRSAERGDPGKAQRLCRELHDRSGPAHASSLSSLTRTAVNNAGEGGRWAHGTGENEPRAWRGAATAGRSRSLAPLLSRAAAFGCGGRRGCQHGRAAIRAAAGAACVLA